MNVPIYFNNENIINSMNSPGIVHCRNTTLVNFFKRYLYQKSVSTIECNIPDTWNKTYLLYVLFCNGFCAVVKTDKFGVIPQMCSVSGMDVYYSPTHALISNPLLRGILQPRIHVQCTVLKLTPDYCGIDDLITYYADKMALAAESIDVNLINTKMAYVFAAANKAAAQSFSKLYDEVASGKPATIIDKNLLRDDGTLGVEMFCQNLKQNYLVSDLLSDLRKIEQEFDTVIGIPNANTDKRERLISDEVRSNDIETSARLDLWMDSLKDGAKETNEMFGLDISFDKRYKNEGGVLNVRDEGND